MTAPRDAIIAVTHQCNAQCVMCNIWRNDATDRLAPQHMDRLPVSLRTINLSGGEPFLREDLPAFVQHIRRRCPRAQITISTNGSLPDRIAAGMEAIGQVDHSIRLAVSLDGLGEAHDTQRGHPGAFEKVMHLIETLKDRGFNGLRLSMTLTKHNLDQLADVAALAHRLDLELGIVAAHDARAQLRTEPDQIDMAVPDWLIEPFTRVITQWLRSWRPKLWLRAHFTWGTWRYLINRPWHTACRAGREFFFLQADGAVYSCSSHGRVMGNLIDQPWDEVWSGQAAKIARDHARRCPQDCWMICTVRGMYRRSLLKLPAWLVLRKLQAHLRLLRLPGQADPREADGADSAD